MDQEKMGLFIAQLRKEKNLSQYDLAELIPITRDAVSKWERGKRCPEPECLIKLSEIFDVSINELLYGERTTKINSDNIDEVPIKLYDERNKKQKTLKILIGIILFFNHFSKIYVTKDPTPIEIEMTTYEKETNTSIIDALNRKQKSGE